MSQYLTIIAIAWLCNLLVAFYVNRAVKNRLPIRKPFSCEKCLAFWIALIYFLITMQPILESVIFASLTSLVASLLRGITLKLNS